MSLCSLSLQSKLVKYFSRQLSCKKKVALQERNAELDGFPQLRHWFRIVDVRKEVLEVTVRPCPPPPLLARDHILCCFLDGRVWAMPRTDPGTQQAFSVCWMEAPSISAVSEKDC